MISPFTRQYAERQGVVSQAMASTLVSLSIILVIFSSINRIIIIISIITIITNIIITNSISNCIIIARLENDKAVEEALAAKGKHQEEIISKVILVSSYQR